MTSKITTEVLAQSIVQTVAPRKSNRKYVVEALNNNGYITEESEIISARFVKWCGNGNEMFEITFPYEGGVDRGFVYIRQNAEGKMIAEY